MGNFSKSTSKVALVSKVTRCPWATKDSKKAIHVGTIIVQTAKMKTVDKVGRQEISFIGTGTAKILQRGKLINATWSKKTPRDYTEFTDSTGKNIIFQNKYPVWIQVISPRHKVSLNSQAKKINSKKKKKSKKAKKGKNK
jgi:hypothetical protein